MMPVTITQGDSPVILGLPHGGTYVPDALMARLNDRGRRLSDTDWHIAQLYQGLLADVTIVEATFHRYVIDANRDPAGASLYPGANTTTLCPTTDFDGLDIWSEGQEPTLDEIAARRAQYHAPYHAALAAEVERVKARHGVAIVFDCHSIRSTIPRLFPGLLPQFNIGTNSGASCAPDLQRRVVELAAASGLSFVANGRFKGGWITRGLGNPAAGVHAIQMELACRGYMREPAHVDAGNWPSLWDPAYAEPVRRALAAILEAALDFARSAP